MKYFDPKRPEQNGRRYYVSKTGKPIAPLPSLVISPLPTEAPSEMPDGSHVEIGCHLITGPMSASWFSLDTFCVRVVTLMLEWADDPEAFMEKHFSYTYEPTSPPRSRPSLLDAPSPKKTQLSLADLGL